MGRKHGVLLAISAVLMLQLKIVGQAIVQEQHLEMLDQSALSVATGFPALTGIDAYKLNYVTVGADQTPDTASGLLVLPLDKEVKGIIAYQHGTSDYNDVPSGLNNESVLARALAGQGYIVTAADYIGMGDSRGFHPYVHAETEASAGIDLLIAGLNFAGQQGFQTPDKIFVTGYSQGGHGAMAMAKALQERPTDDLWITAAAPLSGPYSLSEGQKEIILSDSAEYFFPGYLVYALLGYQEVYQNIYQDLEEVFKPVFIPNIRKFYNHEFDLGTLNEFLIKQLISDHGKSLPKHLFVNEFLNDFTADSLHPANLALTDNDVYEWVPQFPMRLFYCMADDQVNFKNSLIAEEYMNNQGAPDVKAVDVNPNADHGECVLPAILATLEFFNSFSLASHTRESALHQLEIFPNPPQGFLEIKNEFEGKHFDYSIFNQGGQLIKRQQNTSGAKIKLPVLAPGTYFIHITSSGKKFGGTFQIHRDGIR